MTAAELRAWAGDRANALLENVKLATSIVRPILHTVAKAALIMGYRKGFEVAREAAAANEACCVCGAQLHPLFHERPYCALGCALKFHDDGHDLEPFKASSEIIAALATEAEKAITP